MNPNDIQIDDSVVVSNITFNWNRPKIAGWEKKFMDGIGDMAWDMRTQALHNAPYVTGALRNSIRVLPLDQEDGPGVKVVAGGTSAPMDNVSRTHGAPGTRFVDYAAKRERGPNRNPATEHYMANARASVMSGAWEQKYFGGISR